MTATTWPTLLKTKRAEQGINQADLADLIGVSRQAVSMWESTAAAAWPKPEHVRQLVTELGITSEELAALYGAPEPKGDVA